MSNPPTLEAKIQNSSLILASTITGLQKVYQLEGHNITSIYARLLAFHIDTAPDPATVRLRFDLELHKYTNYLTGKTPLDFGAGPHFFPQNER